ncbi:type IV pilus twitching motility protein PilT [Candidatus Berkelbacteria bacterium]|nr:type IV pilus twitching motility protein PilT [Candidatus Berkelbacteria bacterium]
MTEAMTAEMKQLLDTAISRGSSDLHITVGMPPTIRIDGKLMPVDGASPVTPESAQRLLMSIMTAEQMERLQQRREIDFSFGYESMRFRTNAFYERGSISVALRLIPRVIRSLEDLGVPPILERFTEPSQGFVIITGPTGHGKSTTLAALIEAINQKRAEHIITIEDPIEYVFDHKKSMIVQREVGSDTNSFARALRSSLREDPNVVLVGEMRDLETIEAALTLAETGHLVFTTLHTNSAAQTADRIIDVFPPHQQQQVRMQLANVLLGVVSQRLLPRAQSGRILATEIMVANSAVRNTIREGKTHQLNNIIQTSAAEGMISLDKVMAELVSRGEITIDTALSWAIDPKAFKMMVY